MVGVWIVGRSERRQVVATALVLIGKEANQVGESEEADRFISAVEKVICRSPVASTSLQGCLSTSYTCHAMNGR